MAKECPKCELTLDETAFNKDKSTKDGLTRRCRVCRSSMFAAWREENKEAATQMSRDWRAANPEKAKAATKSWRDANPEKVKEMMSGWRDANPEKVKQHSRDSATRFRERLGPVAFNELLGKHRANNPGPYNARSSKARTERLKRHPEWADQEKIAEVYAEAARLTLATGVIHHVDHDIPLQGKIVSGLHVHQNLKVLTAKANLQKGNKFEVSNG